MDLILPDISAQAQIITCTIEGIVEEDDLRELLAGPVSNSAAGTPTPSPALDDPSNLSKLRERHHNVARLIAKGMTQRLTATLCGYTESYLSILLNNPAMQELIDLYRIQQGAASEVIVEKLKTVGTKALEKLEEKLDADQLDNNALIQTAKLGFDRSGFGPQSKQTVETETHVYDHAKLEELNRAARQRNSSRVVSVQDVRKALPSAGADNQAIEDASFEPTDAKDAGE